MGAWQGVAPRQDDLDGTCYHNGHGIHWSVQLLYTPRVGSRPLIARLPAKVESVEVFCRGFRPPIRATNRQRR